MNHYTYEIKFENNMKYIGVRSCRCAIEDDVYTGSSKLIPAELYATCEKTILATFNTRIEAQQDEITRHVELDVARNPEYYNGVNAKSTGFSPIGLTKEHSENVRIRSEKFRAYRGSNRTPAQLEADKRVSEFQKGRKDSSKGNSGMDNPQVKPWYYITPECDYVEVYTSIRQYLPTHTVFKDWSPSKIYERISTKAHIPSVRGVVKGYTFGYLFDKPECITQHNILLALELSNYIDIPNVHKETFKRKTNLISNITGKK